MLKKFLRFILAAALLIQSFTFLAKFYWFFELFTHYAPYYAVFAILFSLLALLRRDFTALLLWVTLALINVGLVLPTLAVHAPTAVKGEALTILSQNFYYLNDQVDEFVDLVSAENPDIIIVHEASDLWRTAKEKLRDKYPTLHLTHNTGIHGIFIASRIPGTFKEVPLGKQVGLVFTPDDLSYQLLAVHPNAPITPAWAKDRNEQFAEIARLTATSSVPVIVMGDFNCTQWSPLYTDLLQNSGLKNAAVGFGFIPTWHAHNPLFQLPIDHALVSPSLNVSDFQSTAATASDHKGIILTIQKPVPEVTVTSPPNSAH